MDKKYLKYNLNESSNSSSDIYYKKYKKYKMKYLELKGGEDPDNENLDFFLNYNTKKDLFLERYEKFFNLDLIQAPIIRIGAASANGFINLIKYKKGDTTFKTILKTSINLESDNNYYEFVVGNCINVLKEYVPNFLYTFLYATPSSSLKTSLKDNKLFYDLPSIKSEMKLKPRIHGNDLQTFSNIGTGCENNDHASVLIEYVPDSVTAQDILRDTDFMGDLDYNLYCLLFQIYAALSGLKTVYTHYDFHTGNIMIIKLPKKMRIEYTNHGTILYTRFIPVIIDYGRSHINCLKLGSVIFSRVFSEISCENPSCNKSSQPLCNTIARGLNVIRDRNNYSTQDHFYNINLRVANESHDLRFLHNYMQNFTSMLSLKSDYDTHFNPTSNPEWFVRQKDNSLDLTYGVQEAISDYSTSKVIRTTSDVLTWLKDFGSINKFAYKVTSDTYGSMTINSDIENKTKWSFVKSP